MAQTSLSEEKKQKSNRGTLKKTFSSLALKITYFSSNCKNYLSLGMSFPKRYPSAVLMMTHFLIYTLNI